MPTDTSRSASFLDVVGRKGPIGPLVTIGGVHTAIVEIIEQRERVRKGVVIGRHLFAVLSHCGVAIAARIIA